MQAEEPIEKMVGHLFRQEAGKMTAILTRLFGFSMLSYAEDIVQDTFLAAYSAWQYGEIPVNPQGWLMQVAKNKAINALKRAEKHISISPSAFIADKEHAIVQQVEHAFSEEDSLDAQLKLLCLCCHPRLSDKQQIVLTLRVLCGFSMQEIAAAMLMKKEAVKKILFRTKQQIKQEGLFANSGYLLHSIQRLDMVRQVLYLMFNEGYKTTEDNSLINKDLCFEAIRLCKITLSLGNSVAVCETKALLSLMFFNAARFAARISDAGLIIPLEEQDRSKWDRLLIKEGYYYLQESRNAGKVSRYHLEAGIAACHCSAKTYNSTNWEQVIFYYDKLARTYPSPVISLNRAIAISHFSGVEAALAELRTIEKAQVAGYYLFHATKADFLYRQGKYELALSSYNNAIYYTHSPLNKKFLHNKIEQCKRHAN